MIRPFRARWDDPTYRPLLVPDPRGDRWAHDYQDEAGHHVARLFCHLVAEVDDVLRVGDDAAWEAHFERREGVRS